MTAIGKRIVRFFVRIHMIAKTSRYLRLEAKHVHSIVCEVNKREPQFDDVLDTAKLLGVSLRLQAFADILDVGKSKLPLRSPPQNDEDTPEAPDPTDIPQTPDRKAENDQSERPVVG